MDEDEQSDCSDFEFTDAVEAEAAAKKRGLDVFEQAEELAEGVYEMSGYKGVKKHKVKKPKPEKSES